MKDISLLTLLKENIKAIFCWLITMLLLNTTVMAQQEAVWTWSMTYSNPHDGPGSDNGTASSFAEAESMMKGSCSICSNVDIDYQIRYSSGVVISVYKPSPQDFPSDYTSWIDNLSLRLQQAKEHFSSSPQCNPSESMQSGDWYDPFAPNGFEPSLKEWVYIDIISNYYNHTEEVCEPHTWERSYDATRTREPVCPTGYVAVTFGSGPATKVCRAVMSGGITSPPQHEKNEGCNGHDNGVGNPCNVATGNKYQSEADFTNKGISFVRSYNSRNLAELGLGKGWRSNHQKKLIVYSGNAVLLQVSSTGRGEPWTKVAEVWQGDEDSKVIITENESGFQLRRFNGVIENYDQLGKILSLIDSNGHQQTYSYNSENQLESVTNHYGHSISFNYADDKLTRVTDTLGAVYNYEYDTSDNLVAVVQPDATPEDLSDNPHKIYHYENVDYPNHLTGITDENGNRYATYAYDSEGKAISTEHSPTTNPVGQERFELDYQTEAVQ